MLLKIHCYCSSLLALLAVASGAGSASSLSTPGYFGRVARGNGVIREGAFREGFREGDVSLQASRHNKQDRNSRQKSPQVLGINRGGGARSMAYRGRNMTELYATLVEADPLTSVASPRRRFTAPSSSTSTVSTTRVMDAPRVRPPPTVRPPTRTRTRAITTTRRPAPTVESYRSRARTGLSANSAFGSTTTARPLEVINADIVAASPRGGALGRVQKQAKKVVNKTPKRSALILIGCLLAMNSGFLNGLALSGLLGQKQAVSAVTGSWTLSALGVAGNNAGLALTQLRMIGSYLLGSLLNGLWHANGSLNWNTPSYTTAPLLLMAAMVLGGAMYYTSTQTFLSLLAITNGMQNSWTSMLLQGNVLRTAHYSGCTSDMGTFLGQVLRNHTENAWKLKIFAKLAASFWVGGLLSLVCAKRWEEPSFLLSVIMYIGIFLGLNNREGNAKPVMVKQR